MEEEKKEEAIILWIDKEKKILTFHALEGYEQLTFRTQEDKLSYVYNLCESGYRVM